MSLMSPDPPWETPGGSSNDSKSTSSGPPAVHSSENMQDDPFFADAVKVRKYQMFVSVYTTLWGEPPTEDYAKRAVNAGLNRWEFESIERKKDAFRKTETYRDEASSLSELLHNIGVE